MCELFECSVSCMTQNLHVASKNLKHLTNLENFMVDLIEVSRQEAHFIH
jgi:hypothetical protein